MKIFLILFFLSLLSSVNVLGEEKQQVGFEPKYGFQDLAIDTWTNKSGLVSNNVISVFQAKDDYLWVMSYNGLQKFDGDKFESYDQTNIPHLTSNTFYECAQGSDEILWLSTGASGIIGYDGEKFFPHPKNNQIPNAIISIFSDSKNRLWIGAKNNGLYLIDENQELSKVKEIPSVTIHQITEDQKGNIWVASDNSGAYCINDEKTTHFTVEDGLLGNHISTIFPKDSSVYVGTLNGLNVIEENQINSIPAFEEDIINDVIVDDFGILWVGTERGIIRYNKKESIYDFFSENDGLPGKRVVDLTFDEEGSLWVCTYEGGLVRFKAGIITNLTIKNGLTSNQVHIVNRYKDKIYIGTQDGNVNIFDGKKISQLALRKEFRNDVIRDIHFEEDEIWIANYRGLVRINGGQQTYINESSGLPNHNLRVIFKDSKGNIWLGSRNGGLIKYDPAGDHIVYDKSTYGGLLTNYVLSIDEDQEGNLLIGTNAGGLSVLSPTGEMKNYSIKNDDSGTLIFNIMVDKENNIWLITNIGLFRFKDGKSEKVTFHPALKMEKFFDMVSDESGTFWLSSPIGVIRVRQSDLQSFISGSKPHVSYEHFGEDDGMESQECTGATPSFFDKKTGKIWIPTFEGVAIIDPSQKIKNQRIPKVYITRVQVDNSSVFPIENGVKIKPGTFRYLFDITSLSFLVPSKVEFMYKLDGIDEQWNGPTKNRRIEYTNLPYGDYTLQVKGSNNDGIWNETGSQLSFTVLPFFFETLWFRLGLIFLFIGLFFGFYKWRVHDIKKTNKVLRKMNTELDHFVYSASHDLRGPLTSTMGIVNLALDEKNPEQQSEYFRLIKQCTDKMNHFINGLINYSKNKNDKIEYREFELKTMIDSIWDGLKERITSNGISLEYDFSSNQKILSDETRLKVILRNLLHNAVVFSDSRKPNPMVKVIMRQNNQHIELSVVDNGLGIPKNVLDNIFDMFFRANDHSVGSGLGLYVVKETSQKLNATINVESEEGKGSSFKITLPNGK
ncbi:two-component regulator propeller domain-containing protein [Reichenbachiella sp.]|uniref:sensor histidine kinase n=1 Tax=Reichenbachiella sp. TaxID=2184521 RepID=UPI003BB02AD0